MVKLEPYYTEARYYKIFIESDGEEKTVTASDIPVEFEGNYLKFEAGFHVLDALFDTHTVEASTDVQRLIDMKYFADASQGIMTPPATNFDYANIYVLGYTED